MRAKLTTCYQRSADKRHNIQWPPLFDALSTTMATSLYIFLILLPSILGQCNVDKSRPYFSRAVNGFSVEIMKRLAEDKENHYVTSPLSLWTLLASTSLGAEGETLEEFHKVLKLPSKPCFRNRYFEIIAGISKTNDGSVLEKSSTMFIDQSMSVRRDFQPKLSKTGLTDVMILPFVNFDTVAANINDYVSAATHHTIQEIVSPSDLLGVHLLLIDALYFKGKWTLPFNPAETKPAPFYDERGNEAGTVNMMAAMLPLSYFAVDQVKAKVLELPYGKGDRFSMLLLLPYSDATVSTVTSLLKNVSLKSLLDVIHRYPADTVQVHLPRFKISSELDNLKELLEDMGLKSMFQSDTAEFSLISDYFLYVSNIVQKADVEVTEEGTEASAATDEEFMSRSLPDQFKANKPFLFLIVDKLNYVPLFSGAYSKPSVY